MSKPKSPNRVRSSELVSLRSKLKDTDFAAGYDAGKNGPNTVNCHFNHFLTYAVKDKWEEGYNSAKARAG